MKKTTETEAPTGVARFTPGTWNFREYSNTPEQIANMRKHGIEPVRVLMNDGAVPLMAEPEADSEENAQRIALVDCQTKFKRGEGYKAECAQRDANARLFAQAKRLYLLAEAVAQGATKDHAAEARAILELI